MSRIGKKVVELEKGISLSLNENRKLLVTKGGAGSLHIPFPEHLELKTEGDNKVFITRTHEDRKTRALHGLTRSLVQNAVIGLSKGWSKSLELKGVGYKASVSGNRLQLNVGYSHPIVHEIPKGIEIKVEKQTRLTVKGADKEQVGLVSARIRACRPVEPYLGKGIRYSDEEVRRKSGKSKGGGKGDKA